MGRTVIKESFGDWCRNNDHEELLELWDYKLNKDSPFEVGSHTGNKYYFKCKRKLHESTLKRIRVLTKDKGYKFEKGLCDKCNSFGQFVVDNYGLDVLNKLWNNKNECTPFEIFKSGSKKVILNCLNNPNHPPRIIRTNSIKNIYQCSYCNGDRICKENSLAYNYPKVISLWSDKNQKSPYEYFSGGDSFVWLKCENGKHDDFKKQIKLGIANNFSCNKCRLESYVNYKFKDLTGQTFGLWKVIELNKELSKQKGSSYWICECSCEKHTRKSVLASHLIGGRSKSCGCRWKTATKGELNYNWKGGISNDEIRTTFDYKNWVKQIFQKDNYVCQCCGKSSVYLNAHHILNFSEYDNLRFDTNNGITLCQSCHIKKGGFHSIYGKINNTPEQLEEYINNKRTQLGISLPFSIEEYKSGINLLKPSNKNNVI